MKTSLVCTQCGAIYFRRSDRAAISRFCSAVCQQAASRTRIETVCFRCGESVSRKPSEVLKTARFFCSKTCHDAEQLRRVEVNCEECGKAYSVYPSSARKGIRKLCSVVCRTAHLTKCVPVTCIACGTVKSRHLCSAHESRFCSRKCFNHWRGENGVEGRVREALDEMGVKFIQEHPIAPYFIDFYLTVTNTALEIDGHYHTPERDARRDATLLKIGVPTIRIKARILRHKDLKPTLAKYLAGAI